MKKTILFLTLCLVFCLNINAQEKKGGLGGRTFVYGEEVIARAESQDKAKLSLPIEIDEKDARPLNEILEEKLAGTGIEYKITASHVLLFVPKEKTPAKQFTIYGYVIDAESKESLIGANVYIPLYQSGNNTNVYGHFSVTIPEGETFLQTSYVGYKTDTRTFLLNKDTLITIALQPKRELAEVVVVSDRPETGIASTRSGAVTVPVQQILRTPALLGEADVIKALHLQPGVQSSSAGQVSMSVRGGNTDQNLFLMDGMLLYNVDHVLGFESAFMPDAVKHVDFYRGSFPARYGGRLSSVTDVRTKDGDMQNYHGNFSIGLLSSHLTLEGPIWKDRTSFIVSTRRTYLDRFLNYIGHSDTIDDLGLYFYDFNAKINHKFSDKDRLYLTFFSGRDVIDIVSKDVYDNEGEWGIAAATWKHIYKTGMNVRWGNTLYNLRWNHIFSPKLFANFSIGYNRFKLSSIGESSTEKISKNELEDYYFVDMKFKTGIDDLNSAIDFDFHPNTEHHVRMGAQYTLHTFRPEVLSSQMKLFEHNSFDITEKVKSGNDPITGHESAIYMEDDINLNENWQLNAGLRTALFITDGKIFPALEPRISASRLLPRGFRAKGSYTVMHQYVHRLQTSQIATPSDLWIPVTKDMKPMSAHQLSIGLAFSPQQDEDWFAEKLNGWEFSSEIFYKKMNNVVDFIDGANFQGNSKGWENKISTGKGRSYGIEFNVNKTLGKTTGMFNYTLAKTNRWYPDGMINGGRHFPYRYDRRHVVHFLVQHQLTKRIDVNASWNFMSGALASVAKQQSQYIYPSDLSQDKPTQIVEDKYISGRNNYRLASTHQLDLGINFHKKKKHGERIWNISIINAYNHYNQDLLYSELKYEENKSQASSDILYVSKTSTNNDMGGEVKRILKQVTLFPILPSFTYTYKF